eukprot:1192430-Prorocentrum_minimum.AAC.1
MHSRGTQRETHIASVTGAHSTAGRGNLELSGLSLADPSMDQSTLGLDAVVKPLLSRSTTGEFNSPPVFFAEAEKKAPKTKTVR